MNIKTLNKANNENLIVFFAGWSFDEKPFEFLNFDRYDVVFVYDYNNYDNIEQLESIINKKYKSKTLITWSMGVYVAYKFKNLFKDFEFKIAINGTTRPVDNEFGIPIRMFELTLKHAQKGLEGKFYQNLFKTDVEYEKYISQKVERTIENRVSELNNLYNDIKTTTIVEEKFYDVAIISKFDKIIPPKNQVASHNKVNTKIIELETGHFPYFEFNSWSDIIELCKSI